MKLANSPSSEQTPLIQANLPRTKLRKQTRFETDDHSSLSNDNYSEHGYLLQSVLYPEDSFQGQTYWGDLPADKKPKWVRQQYRNEVAREFVQFWQTFKQNPLHPLKHYLTNYAIGGTGFFTEGYVLFSVGNVMPLFKSIWPQCWADHIACDEQMINAVKYMEILGIIIGQLGVGYIGDRIGRRWGLIHDAAIMLLGTILLTAMWGTTLNSWVIMYGVCILIFGLGVGGEYPMTSTTSMEKQQGRDDRLHRGRSVLLAFLMQGWGQLANQLALILILYLFNHTLLRPYGEFATQATFRISFVIAAGFSAYFLYLRVFYVKNPDKNNSEAPDLGGDELKTAARFYWSRILATTGCWFCSDFAFYGNQVFRNQLLQLVTGTSAKDVKTLWLYNLLNILIQLLGYYLAALLIDHKGYGRKNMQMVGFGMMFVLFVTCAGAFPLLNQAGTGAKVFQALYLFSNFWVQFGPNATTFLVAGEVYPKQVRSMLHGTSAAAGKTGALAATVLYNYIEDRTKFWLVSLCALIGFLLTALFVPDTTSLTLEERSRYWKQVLNGTQEKYHGMAIHPDHLSWYEKVVLKRSDNYDPELDAMQRIADLRKKYVKTQNEEEWQVVDENGPAYLDEDIRQYFVLEGTLSEDR